MIPVSLRLRNFMCYREGTPSLEFGDIHIACISGPNGAGKSALLDAITWALWGRARSRSDDALITTGAQEMEVEFEFLLEGNHYRVFRRRDRAAGKGSGKSQLDLQVYGALGWRSMAGESIRQTEAAITSLLRMDYETFINSAFLLQGRADEFTIKPPAERKRILAEILGLSYYDVLEQRARERLRIEERSVQSLGLLLQELEQQLGDKETQAAALVQAQEGAQQLEEEAGRRQEELGHLQSRLAELEAAVRQTEDTRRRIAQIEKEAGRLQEQMSPAEARLEGLRALIARADDIESGHTRLQDLRERNQALAQAAGRLLALAERQRTLEQALERARSSQATEAEVLRRSLQEILARLKERPALTGRLAELEQELAGLRDKETGRDRLREETQELVAAERTHRAEMQRLRDEMDGLRGKLDMLAGDATACPLCHNPLDPTSYQHIQDAYQAEGEEKRDQYRTHENTLHQTVEHLEEVRKQQERIEQELKKARALEGQRAALEREVQELDRLAEERALKEGRLEEIEHILETNDYAPTERAALAELQAEIAVLHYDRDEHDTVQRELAENKAVEEEYRQLRSARERLAEEEGRLKDLQATLLRHRDEAAEEQQRLDKLEAGLVELPALQQRRQEAETTLRTAQDALGQARLALGAARRELERLQEVEQSHQEKKKAHQEAAERRGIYDELVSALGKRGVQAMLIETAVPEIEREANELLGRMTDGEMALQLAMQRATKQGNVVETLDINISDAFGTRAYESFSGGETFRINFALRIALSRLLARRAGASLQTLVIDEGFGTQDAEGRERLIEAIGSIQNEFEKVLVITHIQELKEAFPMRIEIERTTEGSRWVVR
jgi:exonuclease SbcC